MHPYLFADICFLCIWFALFLISPQGRRRMILYSLVWAPAAPIMQTFYVHDYWMPEYLIRFDVAGLVFGIEDFLFAFTVAGIVAAIFDLSLRRMGYRVDDRIPLRGYLKLQGLGFVCPLLLGGLMYLFQLNSVHATVVFCVIGATVVLLHRGHEQWLAAACVTALVAAVGFWAFYQIFFLSLFPTLFADYWYPEALSGIHLGDVPIEEIVWAGAIGLFMGPVGNHCLVRMEAPASGRWVFFRKKGTQSRG